MLRQLHPVLSQLLNALEPVILNTPTGVGATDSFWYQHSRDCGFLEWSDDFYEKRHGKLRVEFYPDQKHTAAKVSAVTLHGPDDTVTFEVDTKRIIRKTHSALLKYKVEHQWLLRDAGDKAQLVWWEARDLCGGSLTYARGYETGWRNAWSRDATNHPWTAGGPKTLATRGTGLVSRVLDRKVIPHISAKTFLDIIIERGKFTEFQRQICEKTRTS